MVTKTLFNKNNVPLSPRSVLSSLGRNWTGRRTEKSSCCSQACFICTAARNSVCFQGSLSGSFSGSTNRPQTDHSSDLSGSKKNWPEMMFQPWDRLASPALCYHVKTSLSSPLKGRAANTRLPEGNRPWHTILFKCILTKSGLKLCQGAF